MYEHEKCKQKQNWLETIRPMHPGHIIVLSKFVFALEIYMETIALRTARIDLNLSFIVAFIVCETIYIYLN